MTKSLTAGMLAHIALEVTTLAYCWYLVRKDGTIYAFTSHDQDIVYSGVTYLSVVGFQTTAVESSAGTVVDNLDVAGFLDGAGAMDSLDVEIGLFDYADIYLFLVNWADTSMGQIRMRRGYLGECVSLPNGAFTAEMRGLSQLLTQEIGAIYSPICRNQLGDSNCGLPLNPGDWTASATVAVGDYAQAATRSTDALLVAIFQAVVAGTAHTSEPTWDTTVGNITTETTGVQWQCLSAYRCLLTINSVEDSHTLIAAGSLAIPAIATPGSSEAAISIRNNVSSGTTVTIGDGLTSIAWIAPYDMLGSGGSDEDDAVHGIYDTITASGLLMTVSMEGSNLTLINNSGSLGTIVVTLDTAGAIVVQSFNQPPLTLGMVNWVTGANTGLATEIKAYDSAASRLILWLTPPSTMLAGDKAIVYPGCDGTRSTCRYVYDNVLNKRSEDDMPGNNKMFEYPGLG